MDLHHSVDAAIERLAALAHLARRQADRDRRPVLACAGVRCPGLDPLTLFERGGSDAGTRMLFLRPDDGFGLAGVGEAGSLVSDGPGRFVRADGAWRAIAGGAVTSGDGTPIALYGFAFEDGGGAWNGYPAGLLVTPRVAVLGGGDDTRLILSTTVDPEDRSSAAVDATIACLRGCTGAGAVTSPAASAVPLQVVGEFPAEAEWKRSVAETAQAVRDGRLRKAVLARGIRVRGGRLDPAAALRRLRREYPACTTFAIGRGGRCFLGASPEQLVRVHDGELHVAALAGSAPRGQTDTLDRRLGAGLLASEKNRIEHALVVDALREALAGIATEIIAADAPRLLTIHNTHHLYTPLRARLRERRSVFDLIGRLHPTPAVGGVPRDAALAWIRRHEGWDRGWYAGPVGWSLGRDGDGDAAVAIRCALVERESAELFAGCGIVADSDPEQEFSESGWKLRPLLSALSSATDASRA